MRGEARNSAGLQGVSSSGGSYETNMVIGAGACGVFDGRLRGRGLLCQRSSSAAARGSDRSRPRPRVCLGQRILGLARQPARLDGRKLEASASCTRGLGFAAMGSSGRAILFPRRTLALKVIGSRTGPQADARGLSFCYEGFGVPPASGGLGLASFSLPSLAG